MTSPPIQGSSAYLHSQQALDQFAIQAYGTGSVPVPGSAPLGGSLAWHSLETQYNFRPLSPPHDLAQAAVGQDQVQASSSPLVAQEQQVSAASTPSHLQHTHTQASSQAAVAAWAASLQASAPDHINTTTASTSISNIMSAASLHFPSTPPNPMQQHLHRTMASSNSPSRGNTQSPSAVVQNEQGQTAMQDMAAATRRQQQQETTDATTRGAPTTVAMDISNSAGSANAAARRAPNLGDLPSWNYAMYVLFFGNPLSHILFLYSYMMRSARRRTPAIHCTPILWPLWSGRFRRVLTPNTPLRPRGLRPNSAQLSYRRPNSSRIQTPRPPPPWRSTQ